MLKKEWTDMQDFKFSGLGKQPSSWRAAWHTFVGFCFGKADDEEAPEQDIEQLTLFETESNKDEKQMPAKPRSRYSLWRMGSAAAAFTFCFCLVGAGFILVDYNTRSMGMGDASLRLDIVTDDNRIFINLFGRERAIEISDTISLWSGRIYALIPPTWRCVQWIYEGFCSLTSAIFG